MPLLSLQTLSRRLSGRFHNKKRGDGSNAPSKNGKNCRNAPVFQRVPPAVEGEHTHARNDLRTPFGKGLLPVLFRLLIVLYCIVLYCQLKRRQYPLTAAERVQKGAKLLEFRRESDIIRTSDFRAA